MGVIKMIGNDDDFAVLYFIENSSFLYLRQIIGSLKSKQKKFLMLNMSMQKQKQKQIQMFV